MDNGIGYNLYIDNSPDNKIWRPIPKRDFSKFDKMILAVNTAFESGSKKEKGDTLEKLMTYIYNRFKHIRVYENVRSTDNQIDHIVEFIDGVTPAFINHYVGLRMIGESKNHNKSIGSREVADLYELLRDKGSRLGIFSSYKSFSKGNSMWMNSEGKRRKLALWHHYEKIIIGFTIIELASLKENNFYTLIKQKYYQIVDELKDDYTDTDEKSPYHHQLFHSLVELHKNGIIDSNTLEDGKSKIESVYGKLDI
ncbi:hypothetical protein ACFVSW_20300 [Neobacillus sp. NPDC058068]|uniref:hypothetical protein n=1 Tax=Neobacillus sp. NPDC058068 TaxID=3346325 RepID=UPI0036DBAFAA